jgi:hypothetical protein
MSNWLTFVAGDAKVDPNSIGVPKVDLTQNTLGDVFSAVLVFVGAMCLLFMLVGAARYVTANGDPKQVTTAKNTIIYALIGMVVSSMAFIIVQFVLGRLIGNLT